MRGHVSAGSSQDSGSYRCEVLILDGLRTSSLSTACFFLNFEVFSFTRKDLTQNVPKNRGLALCCSS